MPRRAVAAAALVVGVAVLVAVAGDTRAWSGSDAGGRAATAVAMQRAGTWVPDVGYWAAPWDPAGALHPLINTERRGDHWVQATSVPFAVVERAAYGAWGAPGLLALPMAGLLMAAVAAGALARWAGATRSWPAILAVGLCTPAVFYATDAWEHAPALGLGLAALALALAGRGWSSALLAGLAAGLAVVLRAEVALYVLAAAAVALVMAEQRRRWLEEWRRALVIGVGAVIPVVGNALLERALLGVPIRADRAAALAEGAGRGLDARLSDAALTTWGVVADSSIAALGLGLVVAGGLLVLARWALVGRPRPLFVGVGAIGLAVAMGVRLDDGLGFVPGWLPAAPLAAAGLVAARRAGPRLRFLAAVSVVALPLVWATAHVGLLEAQWGGRYALLTGALLTVAGVVALDERRGGRAAPAVLVGAAVAVAFVGLGWHVERTRTIASVGAWVAAQSEPDAVVISRWPDLGRETGAWYGEQRWLTAEDRSEVAAALRVAAESGAGRVVLLLPPRASAGPTPGWEVVGRASRPLFGARLEAVSMRRTG